MLPLSVHQRVLAKYMTILLMFGVGVVIDLGIAYILSILTDIISFADFMGIILSAASIMSIYGALVIIFCFAFGQGKEDYARVLSLLCMLASALLANLSGIKKNVVTIAYRNDNDSVHLNDFMNFFKQKFYILFAIAVLVMVISYFTSVYIAGRKRGVV